MSFEIHTDDNMCSVCSSWNCPMFASRNLTSQEMQDGRGRPFLAEWGGWGGVGYILSGNMKPPGWLGGGEAFLLVIFPKWEEEGGRESLSEYPVLDVCCVDHHPSLAGPGLVSGQLRPANKSRLDPQKSLDLFKTPIIFRLSCKSACLAGAWVLIVSL